jgi:hypothetical protein
MSTVPSSASAASATPAANTSAKEAPQPVCYTAFNKQTTDLPGFANERGRNVKLVIAKKEKATGLSQMQLQLRGSALSVAAR